MSYTKSTYMGDPEYTLDCTGDACVGDEVRFEKAVFTGSYKDAKFSHYELISAKIIGDSYGRERQQHTFTLKLPDGSTKRIKGRNLYRHGTWRKPWSNEDDRERVLEEKHHRGNVAREARRIRKGMIGDPPFQLACGGAGRNGVLNLVGRQVW